MTDDSTQETTQAATGIVYVLTNPAMEGYIKIGKTQGDSEQAVRARMRQLDVTGVPRAFTCEYAAVVDDYETVEKALHTGFGENRVRPNREFFEGIPPFRVKALLKLHTKKDVTPDSPENPAQDEVERPPRAENFRFPMARVPLAATLLWADDPNITCTVDNDKNRVEYQGTRYTLSGLAKELRGGVASQGSLYWLYEGETLQERRERFTRETADEDNENPFG